MKVATIRASLVVSGVVLVLTACVTQPPSQPPSQQQSQQQAPPSQPSQQQSQQQPPPSPSQQQSQQQSQQPSQQQSQQQAQSPGQQSSQGQQAEQQAQQQNQQAQQQGEQGQQQGEQGQQQSEQGQQQAQQQAQQQGEEFGGFPPGGPPPGQEGEQQAGGPPPGQPVPGEADDPTAGQDGSETRQAQGGPADENVFGDGIETTGDGQMAEAEGAFDRSLEEFDAIMGDEQEQMARTGVGSAADEAFGSAGEIGNAIGSNEQPSGQGAQGEENPSESGNPMPVFEDRSGDDQTAAQVEGCNDQDKVARQLCEAATEEQDPFLRAALWDEYNDYKQIILRQ